MTSFCAARRRNAQSILQTRKSYDILLTRRHSHEVLGGIVIALIYFAMCFSGGTSTVSFAPYPYDLLHNLGHGTGFFTGTIVALLVQIPLTLAHKETA